MFPEFLGFLLFVALALGTSKYKVHVDCNSFSIIPSSYTAIATDKEIERVWLV